jgi:Secretion system C-terminal sorting domain
MALSSISLLATAQFTPGEGGALPTFPTFTSLPNKFGGFKVTSSARENNSFGTGTRAIVDMWFPAPSTIGATSYTLQYSVNGTDWANYQSGYADVTTTGDNFSMNLDGSYYLRILANGGPKNGYTSNEVYAPLSGVDTYLGGWGLDESMYLSGIMAPWAGRGLLASFTMKMLSDASVVNNCMTYQWYKLNPLTYETTLIPGADSLKYITTEADAGYDLLVKATTDGVNAGGFAQIISSSGIQIGNKSFATNVNSSGFTLNLFKTVSGLSIGDLTLTDKDAQPVSITAVNQGANAAIYIITATLDPAKSPYTLSNNSRFWKIASTFMMMDLMPFLNISVDPPTEINTIETSTAIFPNPTSDVINIQSEDIIKEVNLIGVNGEIAKNIIANSDNITFNVSNLSSGMYVLHINTDNAMITRKIEIKR